MTLVRSQILVRLRNLEREVTVSAERATSRCIVVRQVEGNEEAYERLSLYRNEAPQHAQVATEKAFLGSASGRHLHGLHGWIAPTCQRVLLSGHVASHPRTEGSGDAEFAVLPQTIENFYVSILSIEGKFGLAPSILRRLTRNISETERRISVFGSEFFRPKLLDGCAVGGRRNGWR